MSKRASDGKPSESLGSADLEDARIDPILTAAYTCFTRHGVRRTTMDDIAREAGMSRPAVYQYVRNKEDVFRRLTRRLLAQTLADARAGLESEDELADQLTSALEAKLRLTLRLWQDSPAHAAELLSVDARTSADLISEYEQAMRDLLAGAAGRAVPPRAEAEEFADLLLAFTRGLEADLTDHAAPVRRLRHGVHLFVAGLGHAPTPSRTKPMESV